MASKLVKLKSMLKRRHSSNRLEAAAAASAPSMDSWKPSASIAYGDRPSVGLHTVYVGRARREYRIGSDVISHPLFQVLLRRSGECSGGCGSAPVVDCEVVLFEHLLWMLENADPQPESVDELVEFYACG